ncbi:hypothetical protein DRN74_04975 [Candidatus Micrarchaeota archaeon]|nr:MAG: hypothetical protein DRN74_04975 [Candidatus Micrarchaeota archaeon]
MGLYNFLGRLVKFLNPQSLTTAMVMCSICKKNKETKVNWIIEEHSVDNSVLHSFRVCDDCAAKLIRKIVSEMKLPVSSDNLILNYTGLIGDITLNDNNELEVKLLMDLAKARKIVLNSLNGTEIIQ